MELAQSISDVHLGQISTFTGVGNKADKNKVRFTSININTIYKGLSAEQPRTPDTQDTVMLNLQAHAVTTDVAPAENIKEKMRLDKAPEADKHESMLMLQQELELLIALQSKIKMKTDTQHLRECTHLEEMISKRKAIMEQKVDTSNEDASIGEHQDVIVDKLEKGEIRDVEKEEDGNRSMLKCKYKEDQWSPLNPEGQKHYDREFLIQFQFHRTATTKPAGFPNIPGIVLEKPIFAGKPYNDHMLTDSGGAGCIYPTPNPKILLAWK